jgi:hypothetical protein
MKAAHRKYDGFQCALRKSFSRINSVECSWKNLIEITNKKLILLSKFKHRLTPLKKRAEILLNLLILGH